MYCIYAVKHSEATPLDWDSAISLKSVAWPYPKESQIQWMRENLKPEDLHVFLMQDGTDVAYLNIAILYATINGR